MGHAAAVAHKPKNLVLQLNHTLRPWVKLHAKQGSSMGTVCNLQDEIAMKHRGKLHASARGRFLATFHSNVGTVKRLLLASCRTARK